MFVWLVCHLSPWRNDTSVEYCADFTRTRREPLIMNQSHSAMKPSICSTRRRWIGFRRRIAPNFC